MADFKRAHRTLVTRDFCVLLHLLTPRALARAPLHAFVSAATLVAIAGASLISAAPNSKPVDLPDLALVVSPQSPVVQNVTTSPSTPAPIAADLTCLAKAVYYEARGESEDGQAAVAQVVLNRTRRPEYAHSVCGVVFQGVRAGQCQFSFACNGAMGHPLEPAAWSRARRIALSVFNGARTAPVGQAVSFHTAAEGNRGRVVAHIGGHLFFGSARI